MPVIERIQTISRKNLDLLTVLTGEDQGQYQLAKNLLFQQIGYTTTDLTYAYFDMSETDYSVVELDLVSLPFFADEKIVILDYFSDLTTAKKRYLTDEELKRFEQYLEDPAVTTRLIVCAPGKLDSKRRLVKLLKRDAAVLEAAPLKEQEIRNFFQKELHKQGLSMPTPVLQAFLMTSNFDFSELTKNIHLLLAYKGRGEIGLEDIREVLPRTLQDNLFDVIQLLLQVKMDQVRSLVRDLVMQGEDEIKLLAILLAQFRLYLQVQLLQARRKGERDIHHLLSDWTGRTINPYQIKFALRDSRHLSIQLLERIVLLLIETDFQMKTGKLDKAYLFDLCLLKIAHMASESRQKS